MEIGPIFSSLRRNGVGAILICLQIALTLAIVCNALFIINERTTRMQRPSGMDEANIFTFDNQWVGSPPDVEARVRADLDALRSLPGVVDATSGNSFPLRGGGWSTAISSHLPDKSERNLPRATLYFGDEHLPNAWGIKMLEGRWFTADEIITMRDGDQPKPPVVVVTRALANELFPKGSALGKTVWFESDPAIIIGITDTMQTPWAASAWGEGFVGNSVVLPFLYIGSTRYVVRTKPGQRDATMHAAEAKLLQLSRARVIDNLRPFSETRARRYDGDSSLALILGSVCALLLGVTACGIVGLTSYWIAQRRRQIGVRRALGARRVDILRYFHLENLVIAAGGSILGIGLALGANLWMVKNFEMTRMGVGFVALGGLIVLLLSQAAVLFPALRAAAIPPALAVRAA